MSNLAQFKHLEIPLHAIKSATNNFSDDNLIGKGGYGNVYKGRVHPNFPITVAIKRIDRKRGQGDQQFYEEIATLSYYKHENIVSFLGFCSESDEGILVYEYAPKGSLDMHLHNVDLTWIRRLEICIGAARGLAYLHNPDGGQYGVFHRDIKSSNILLDENWIAKISDFGLARLGAVDPHFRHIYDHPVGTLGYCDPRYLKTGTLTDKSDVYSFGVVLFEVLCGRLCVNKDDKPLLPEVIQACKDDKLNDQLIYCNIREEINPNSLEAFTKIAYRCLKEERTDRPSAADIVRELETSLNLQIKPLNQQLDQHNHKTEERERAIFKREKAMTQRENLVFKREQAIFDQEQAISDREQAIYEREQALFVREQALTKREQALSKRE